MAILSALELVNLLYDIDEDSQEEISQVFEKYYEARHSASVAAVDASHQMGFLMHRKVCRCAGGSSSFNSWCPIANRRVVTPFYRGFLQTCLGTCSSIGFPIGLFNSERTR